MTPGRYRTVLAVLALSCALAAALAGCGQGASTAMGEPPSGWSWYTDDQFAFRLPVPPNWHSGAYDNDTCTKRVVDLFPAGSSGRAELGYDSLMSEFLSVAVNIGCPTISPDHLASCESVRPDPIKVAGVSTTVYQLCGSESPSPTKEWRAEATFGGRQYNFLVKAPVAQFQDDYALFTTMLNDFKPPSEAS